MVLATQGLCALGIAWVSARRLGPWSSREGASTAVAWGAIAGAAALLPALATYPLDRMLLLPGVGLAIPVAAVMSALWDARYAEKPGPQAALAGKLGFLVAVVHLIGPGFAWHITSGSAKEGGETLAAAVEALPVDEAALPEQHLMLLNGSDPNVALYLPHHRQRAGRSTPAAWAVVTMSPADHEVWRIDAHTLGFRVDDPEAPPVTAVPLVRLLRDAPFPVGVPIRRPGLVVVSRIPKHRRSTRPSTAPWTTRASCC